MKGSCFDETHEFSKEQPQQSPFFCKIEVYRFVTLPKERIEKLFGKTTANNCCDCVRSKATSLHVKFKTVVLLGVLACILFYMSLKVEVLVQIFKIRCHSLDAFTVTVDLWPYRKSWKSLPKLLLKTLRLTEAVIQRCSVKKVFLRISQISQENTCARVSFLIKLQAWLWTPFLQNTSGRLLLCLLRYKGCYIAFHVTFCLPGKF